MKKFKKMILLLWSIIIFMPGCIKAEGTKDIPVEIGKYGVYVKLERDDVSSVLLQGGGFSKAYKNTDGSLLKAGKWVYMGGDIARLSNDGNCSILFTVEARNEENTVLEEASFLYDVAQKKLYVKICPKKITCAVSDAFGTWKDVPYVQMLPILEEMDADITVGTAGFSRQVQRSAAKLLDWGRNTSIHTDIISDAAMTWLAAQGDGLTGYLKKMQLIDEAYQKLLKSAVEIEREIAWGSEEAELPIEAVEAVMQAAGRR